ncbi:MAG: hypothetical protein WCD69_03235 [Xanthobacteraceae bacterium]
MQSSLNGGSLGHGGIDELMPPALPLDADTLLVPDPVLNVDTPLDPYPPSLGPLGTLQNVAVISSVQRTPVVGAWVASDWTL